MEVIHLSYPFQATKIDLRPKVMALGFFDGVHRGHQAVIKTALAAGQAADLPVAVMTFDKYPGIVFQKVAAADFTYLSTLARKIELMAGLGVDYLYVVDFTSQVGHLTPQSFVDQFLVGLGVHVAVAGFDYTYGPKTIADMAHLPAYAQDRFEIIEVPQQQLLAHKISSSAIRDALAGGQVETANHLLGYVYQTSGIVVHGEARGRTLGYPTANIRTTHGERLPGVGIYTTEILVQGRWYPSMTSIGRNVTFGTDHPLTVECNIFDFDQDIYGETVKLRWHHYLRGEVKFTGAAGLVAQLQKDAQQSRAFLAAPKD
ncbi:riboflavin biosynthesis protein RibF [Lapidilactobacillus luobeiensis]|uniref:riboflavin biosynthesis protein RibF n=1 Tax=Lapidilactobacillus luobeiensis TaxID=2950371 RepID=UPI0021C3B7CF|nr:riboflavin biosynthesis protein RibF [Lapidilactobacillus luobeiensis]